MGITRRRRRLPGQSDILAFLHKIPSHPKKKPRQSTRPGWTIDEDGNACVKTTLLHYFGRPKEVPFIEEHVIETEEPMVVDLPHPLPPSPQPPTRRRRRRRVVNFSPQTRTRIQKAPESESTSDNLASAQTTPVQTLHTAQQHESTSAAALLDRVSKKLYVPKTHNSGSTHEGLMINNERSTYELSATVKAFELFRKVVESKDVYSKNRQITMGTMFAVAKEIGLTSIPLEYYHQMYFKEDERVHTETIDLTTYGQTEEDGRLKGSIKVSQTQVSGHKNAVGCVFVRLYTNSTRLSSLTFFVLRRLLEIANDVANDADITPQKAQTAIKPNVFGIANASFSLEVRSKLVFAVVAAAIRYIALRIETESGELVMLYPLFDPRKENADAPGSVSISYAIVPRHLEGIQTSVGYKTPRGGNATHVSKQIALNELGPMPRLSCYGGPSVKGKYYLQLTIPSADIGYDVCKAFYESVRNVIATCESIPNETLEVILKDDFVGVSNRVQSLCDTGI